MSSYMYDIVLNENDVTLGNLQDILSVCVQDIVWAVASQLTQVNLRITLVRGSHVYVVDVF